MKKKFISLFLCVCFIGALFSSCGKKGEGESFTFDLSSAPLNLDPQTASDDASLLVIENIFEGLVKYNQEGLLVSAAAMDYHISSDGLEYTFSINPDAKWHNGEAVTAEDFVFAFQRLFSPSSGAPNAEAFSAIENAGAVMSGTAPAESLGVIAKDDLQLVIHLSRPNPFFIQLLTTAPAMPCHRAFFNESAGKYGLIQESVLSNGPFKLTKWEEKDYLILRKSNDYRLSPVAPSSVTLRIQKDENERMNGFLSGNTDCIIAADESTEKLEGYPGQAVEDITWTLCFNTADSIYSDKDIRKALCLACDKSSYQENLKQYYSMAQGLVPPSISFIDKPFRQYVSEPVFTMDIAQSKELFRKALEKKGLEKLPKTTILVPKEGNHRFLISYIQQLWQKELGAFINLKVLPMDELTTAMEKGEFQIALWPVKSEYDSPDAVLNNFASYSSNNYTSYNSAAFDGLLASAAKQADYAASAKLYLQAEQLLLDDCVAVPMYYQRSMFATQKKVEGIRFSPFGGQVRFQNAKK